MRERSAEYKPLSFSTTMRNPRRIADFLDCIRPFEGQILTNELIVKIIANSIRKKLYKPTIIAKVPKWADVWNSDELLDNASIIEIMNKSPQQHKEAGFDAGWPSRFDTIYKLSMEFGFVWYEMGKPLKISQTGHMLLEAIDSGNTGNGGNPEIIKNVFLNALMKYQTNNPFRKNLCDTAPLPLLLQLLKLLKEKPIGGNDCVARSELSLIICSPEQNAEFLYNTIKKIREKYRFSCSDEVIYDICLAMIDADESQKNRFKIEQITKESVDEFIRKMRATGIVSLRGNGRFIDYNMFEIDNINYVLDNYYTYQKYATKEDYFAYMSEIDPQIITTRITIKPEELDDVKQKTLKLWAETYSFEEISRELIITSNKKESKNEVLRYIESPTRLEFLTSVLLKKQFPNLIVKPNYSVDDEGLPTFTAAGGLADIECFDIDNNPLLEVTMLTNRNQSTNEIPAITRHLQEAIKLEPKKYVFTIFLAPIIHQDTLYMTGYSKDRYSVDIFPYAIPEFIARISKVSKLVEATTQ